MTHCFPVSYRIRTKEEFDQVFKQRQRLFGRYYLVYYCKNQLKDARLGVIISKSKVRYAVKRNQVRRVAKEGFRLTPASLPNMDVVVIAKHTSATASKQELRRCIDQLLLQLSKLR